MNRLLKASLCTFLLGVTSVISSESISSVKSVKNDEPKNNLEAITHKIGLVINSTNSRDNTDNKDKNSYISPDGNYSLAHNPKEFDLSKPSHEVYPMGGYKDTYHDIPNRFLVIEKTKDTGDLDKLYDQYSKFYTQYVTKTVSTYMRPGRKLVPLPMSPLQHIIVDNHPAIRGSVELIVTDSNGNKLNAPQHYLQITVAQYQKEMYGFVFFNRIPRGDEMHPEAINDVLASFRVLK